MGVQDELGLVVVVVHWRADQTASRFNVHVPREPSMPSPPTRRVRLNVYRRDPEQ